MANVVHYYNKRDCPISFNFRGCRFMLWETGDIVKDAEGNPILDPELGSKAMMSLGLAARTAEELAAMRAKPVVAQVAKPLVTTPPTIPVPPKLPSIAPMATPMVAETPKVALMSERLPFIDKSAITEGDLQDPTRLVVCQEGGMWVFKLNNYENASPAGIKAHIRATFGKELLERVKFEA